MPAISKDDFLSCLRASNIVDNTELEFALGEIVSTDAPAIARDLVRRGLLTLWQAKFLLSGRTHLHLGNYRLLERLERNEQGDRFLAVHPQLNRQVEIQLLPSSLSDDQVTIDQFFQKSTRASTIEHPNLAHVYDIDQERNRYYLVEEHVSGQPLGEVSPPLTEVEISRILHQAFDGLRHAHQNGVAHGQLTTSNLLLTQDKQLKIANLALTPVAEQDFDRQSLRDLQDVANIGLDRLARVSSPNPQQQAELSRILKDLASLSGREDFATPYEALENWIRLNDILEPPSNPLADSKQEPAKQDSGRGQDTPDPEAPPKVLTPIGDRIIRNPVLALSIFAAAMLLALGVATWIAFVMQNKRELLVVKSDPAKPSASDTSNNPEKSIRPGEQAEEPQAIDINTVVSTLPGDTNILQPVKKEFPNGKGKKPGGAKPKPGEQTGNDPGKSKPPAQPPKPGSTGDNTPPGNQKPPAKPPAEKPENRQPPPTPPAVGEFEKLPPTAGLPDTTDTQLHTIGQVQIAKNYLLGLELIGGKAVSRFRLIFELERTADDKQKWAVKLKKRPTEEPVVIAHFLKQGSEFCFQWTKDAAAVEEANYLRNCLVRLNAKNSSRFLILRRPVQIEGFSLDEEDANVELTSELNWLPHPEFLKIEVQPFKKDKSISELIVEPRLVEKKTPSRIFFASEPGFRFGWIEITANTRGKLELAANAMIQGPGRPKSATVKQIEALAASLKTEAELRKKQSDSIGQLKKPPGMTDQQFNAYKARIRGEHAAMQKRSLVAANLENGIRAMLGKTIPVSVYYELNGVRISVARTK